MLSAAVFLVVDDHPESRFLLVRTLLRKFPDAFIEEYDAAEPALARVHQGDVTAIITHRTYDVTGIELVRMFRAADPRVPIVMVSGIDRTQPALEAGADAFLHYDEWLRLATVMEQLLAKDAPTGGGNMVA